MDTTALLLSRLQFAFTVSFHIIFPSFTIGLAAWLTVLEALHLRPGGRCIAASSTSGSRSSASPSAWASSPGSSGLRVRHELERTVAASRDRSRGRCCPMRPSRPSCSRRPSSACCCSAGSRVQPWLYLFSTAMVALGTTLSAFWIMVNNSWMQVPVGYAIAERHLRAGRLGDDHLQPGRLGALSAHAARGLRHRRVLRRRDRCVVPAARNVSCRSAHHAAHGSVSRRDPGAGPDAVRSSGRRLRPSTTSRSSSQRSKARWHDEQPASEVLIAWPDADARDATTMRSRSRCSAA